MAWYPPGYGIASIQHRVYEGISRKHVKVRVRGPLHAKLLLMERQVDYAILPEEYLPEKANIVEQLGEEELLLIKGIGAETIRALVLVADLIYKEPPSWRDPVTDPLDPFKYAFAFGGKDGIPFPVKREVMMEAIRFLREALEEARIGRKEKILALRRLKNLARSIGLDEGR